MQLAVAAALVVPFKPLWSLTALDDRLGLHGVLSVAVSVLWIAAITNAFNFLDNMDGLSAGVAAVCTAAFLVAAVSIGQWFVAAALAMLLGALLGFLCFNFAPASIFMGDSGSLLIGLVLGVLTIRTTYLPAGEDLGAGWYAVFAPVIVLAVPLYDLVVVSTIRIMQGKSPFVGDTNHFSHRLVARGMSKRTAVLCLYLITAATAVAATILPHVRLHVRRGADLRADDADPGRGDPAGAAPDAGGERGGRECIPQGVDPRFPRRRTFDVVTKGVSVHPCPAPDGSTP